MPNEEQNQGATQAPTVEARPDGQPVTAQATTSDERPANLREVVEMRKELRETKKSLADILAALQQKAAPTESKKTEQQASAPATDVAGEVAKLRSELALKDALADRQIDKGKRKIVERLYAAERPQDLDDWLESTLESLGFKQAQAAKPAAQVAQPNAAAAAQPTDTGAPSAGRGISLPEHPSALPKAITENWTQSEAVDFYERFKAKSGVSPGNPLAFKKQRHQPGGDAEAIGQAIATALAPLVKR